MLRDFANDATVSGGDVSFMWVIPDVRLEFTDIGWGAAVIVIIYACSQLLSTELSMTPNMPDSQRRLMRLLPAGVIVFLFLFPVPAGLVLYWMTTNLWTCGQQLVMRHRIGLHLADPAEVEAITKKGSRTEPAAAAAAVAASAAEAPAEGGPGRPRASVAGGGTGRGERRRRCVRAGARPGAGPRRSGGRPGARPRGGDPRGGGPEAEAVPAAADGDAPTPAPEDVEGEQPVEASAPSGSSGGSGGAAGASRARGGPPGLAPGAPRSKKRKR